MSKERVPQAPQTPEENPDGDYSWSPIERSTELTRRALVFTLGPILTIGSVVAAIRGNLEVTEAAIVGGLSFISLTYETRNMIESRTKRAAAKAAALIERNERRDSKTR